MSVLCIRYNQSINESHMGKFLSPWGEEVILPAGLDGTGNGKGKLPSFLHYFSRSFPLPLKEVINDKENAFTLAVEK